MTLLFNPLGRVLVVDPHADENYQEASISINSLSLEGTSVFLKTFQLGSRVLHSLQKSLENDWYFYTIGDDYKKLVIQGLAYNSDGGCSDSDGSVTKHAGNQLLDWFGDENAYASLTYPNTINITFGDQTITGLLIEMSIKNVVAWAPLFQFSMVILPYSIS